MTSEIYYLPPYYLTILLTISSFFVNKCDLYNYADDNTLSKSDNTLETVIESLEEDSGSTFAEIHNDSSKICVTVQSFFQSSKILSKVDWQP
jgi:hypothetical protein